MLSLLLTQASFQGPVAAPLLRRCGAPLLSESATSRHGRLELLKNELAAAVGSEEYDTAARLRDELTTLSLDEEVAVLAANAEFYAAFSAKNLQAMEAVWGGHNGDEDVACAHPGFPSIKGRAKVIDSWRSIFRGSKIEVEPTIDCCRLLRGGLSAMVICREKLGDANALTATNVFEKDEHGKWYMVMHQAGPVMMEEPS